MKRINSRQKGAAGEREAAAFLTRLGFKATRGQQHKGSPDSPDVASPDLSHVHIEVKRDQQVRVGTKAMTEALDQASRDCGGAMYAVLSRTNRGPWMLTYHDPSVAWAEVTIVGDRGIAAQLRAMERGGASISGRVKEER